MRREYKASGGILPPGYVECEYIESTGTQYIDTGILSGSDVELHTDFKFTDINARIYSRALTAEEVAQL